MNYRYISGTTNGQTEEMYAFIPVMNPMEKRIFSLLNENYFKGIFNGNMKIRLEKNNFEIIIYDFVKGLVDFIAAKDLAEEAEKLFREESAKYIDQAIHLSNSLELLKYPEFEEIAKEINSDIQNIPFVEELNKKLDPVSTMYIGHHIRRVFAEDLKLLTDRMDKEAGNAADIFKSLDDGICAISNWIDDKVKPNIALTKTIDLQVQSLFNRVSWLELEIKRYKTPWYSKIWNFLTFHWERI